MEIILDGGGGFHIALSAAQVLEQNPRRRATEAHKIAGSAGRARLVVISRVHAREARQAHSARIREVLGGESIHKSRPLIHLAHLEDNAKRRERCEVLHRLPAVGSDRKTAAARSERLEGVSRAEKGMEPLAPRVVLEPEALAP